LEHTGLTLENTGLTLENTGLPLENTGLTLENTGLTLENTGLTLENTGLTLENTLSWDSHLKKLIKNCVFRIHSLYNVQRLLPPKYRVQVVFTLVISLLNYMCCIWSSTTKQNLKKVEKVIRAATRFATGIKNMKALFLLFPTSWVDLSRRTS